MDNTKKCKYCQTEIDKKAKICYNCKKSQKNKFLVLVGIICIIFAVIMIIDFGKTSTNNTIENKTYVTLEDFNKIENGMTYEEVKEIIGSDGTIMSEIGTKEEQFYTIMYYWYGKDKVSNANFTFQNNKLEAKAQLLLK